MIADCSRAAEHEVQQHVSKQASKLQQVLSTAIAVLQDPRTHNRHDRDSAYDAFHQ